MIDPDERPYGCFHCGKTLYGKSNQKYCNDDCRNKGNREKRNKEAWHEPRLVGQVITILKRNYRILARQQACEYRAVAVSKFKLVEANFSFKHFTSQLKTKTGVYNFVFDYGWRELEDGKIMVVFNPELTSI